MGSAAVVIVLAIFGFSVLRSLERIEDRLDEIAYKMGGKRFDGAPNMVSKTAMPKPSTATIRPKRRFFRSRVRRGSMCFGALFMEAKVKHQVRFRLEAGYAGR